MYTMTISKFVIGYVLFYINPSCICFVLLYLCKLKFYVIGEDREITTQVIKKMAPTIITPYVKRMNGRETPTGYFIGYKYIGYIDGNFDMKIYIITTPYYYKELIQHNDIVEHKVKHEIKQESKIVIYIKKGSYKNVYYYCMKMDLSHISPMGDQETILDNIVDVYSKLGRASIFLHGITCAGKSTIGYLLAKKLNGIYCHSFNPSEPGDQLSSLIVSIEREYEPIIIVLEEADCIIKAIHTQSILKHAEFQTSVYNKTTWSSFLDDMVFYKNVILILTSNTSKSDIDNLDESYLRKGRIHASYSMLSKLDI